MAGSVNKAIIVGNLTRDPEVRRMNNGDSVVSFAVATSEAWKDKTSGERKERTEFHNVSIFNEGLGKIAEQYCKKGSKVYIEGQLQTRSYTDRDGNERKTTEIVLTRFKGELALLDGAASDKKPAPVSSNRDAVRRSSPQAPPRYSDVIDDDIPF